MLDAVPPLHELVKTNDTAMVLAEIQGLLDRMDLADARPQVAMIYGDVIHLFDGKFPGYRASNTKYHDLEHTSAVFLAVARLIHGSFVAGEGVSVRGAVLALAGALFHDTGLIQTVDDTDGTGAKYTVGHEARSIQLMGGYLRDRGYAEADRQDCARIISCTIMDKKVADIPFATEEMRRMGMILGAGDLYAQMADRAYLEKLFLLYREFEEAGIAGFDSELMLLEKTEGFYENIVKKRLAEDLGNVSRFMRLHFQTRWEMDADPYEDSIQKNITYLKMVLEETRRIYRERFRRGGIVW